MNNSKEAVELSSLQIDNKEAKIDKWMLENWDDAVVEYNTLRRMKFYERWFYKLGWFFMRRCHKYIDEIRVEWKQVHG